MIKWTLGPVTVYGYGLGLAVSAALGLMLMRKETGGKSAALALFCIPLSLLGARLVYCLIRLPWMLEQGVGFFFDLPRGGLSVHGCVLGLALAGWIIGKKEKTGAGTVWDQMAEGCALFLALARLCAGLSGQGYGLPVRDWFSVDYPSDMSLIRLRDVSFLERFPFAVTDYYGDWLFSVFLLEGLMLLLMTVYLHRHRGEKNRWIRFLAVWLPLQAFGESMRQDAILRFGFVKTGELFCAVGLLLILLVLCIRQGRGRTILSVMGLLGCFGLFMAMEFALEGKIRFLRWMTMDLCYLVIALSCAGMMILVTRHVPGERRSLK